MTATHAGGLKTRDTNRRRYGDDYYPRIARMGGLAKVPKGFAKMPPERLKEVSVKGGEASRRPAL